jgi:hypothetical protein
LKKIRNKGRSKRRLGPAPSPRKKPPPLKYPSSIILESGTLAQLQAKKDYSERLCKYYWKQHYELSIQQREVQELLYEALNRSATENYRFDHWQRVVKYAYSLNPLSPTGSLRNGGGRFNIGDIDPNRFPMFPALYLAENKETALQESLGQPEDGNELSAMDLALTNPQSISILSVSGTLESVFDLTKENALSEFASILSKFKLSPQLREEAKRLGLPAPGLATNPAQLIHTFMDPNWRILPQVVDVPANPQIFGQLVRSAQLVGILYPSKLTDAKCLALFPRNFENTSSLVQLDDKAPAEILTRVDSITWKQVES